MAIDPFTPQGKRAILDTLTRREFPAFTTAALRVIQPDFQPNWHIDAITHFGSGVAQGDILRGIVNAPPRSLKSVILSSVLSAYKLGVNPATKLICVSYNQSVAQDLAANTLKIMQSPFYRRAFPETVLARTAVDDFTTTKGGGRIATSMTGALTGRGADLIIVDDPIKTGEADSETLRPKMNQWYDVSLPSRLNDPRTGQILIVMQRVHEADLTGHVLEQRAWRQLVIPAISQETTTYDLGYNRRHVFEAGQLMFPERLTQAALDEQRIGLGARIFAAQYLQDPTPDEGTIFKREWLRYDTVERRPGDLIVQAWDCAAKTGPQNDYSVGITAIVRRNQVLILDVFRGRLEFPDLKKKVIELAREYRPYKLLIEDTPGGTQLIQMLQDEQPRKVPLPTPVKAVSNKIDRAAFAEARIESGAMILPVSAPWLDAFVEELIAFPGGRHDDQVDALSHLMTNTLTGARPRFAMDQDLVRPSPFFGAATSLDDYSWTGDPDLSPNFHGGPGRLG